MSLKKDSEICENFYQSNASTIEAKEIDYDGDCSSFAGTLKYYEPNNYTNAYCCPEGTSFSLVDGKKVCT